MKFSNSFSISQLQRLKQSIRNQRDKLEDSGLKQSAPNTCDQSLKQQNISQSSIFSIKSQVIFKNKPLSTLEECLCSIGMIRMTWKNENGRIVCINYGTAFAISKRLIVTCGHNIYSCKRKAYCTQVVFVPGLSSERIGKQAETYRSVPGIFYKNMEPQQSMSNSPIKEELALILLENELPGDSFLNFGSLSDESKKESLAIVGYPSNKYSTEVYLSKVKPERRIVKGNLHSINDFIINHTMIETEVGHSGSPIIVLNKDGYEVVGIHTHKGLNKEYKSGIYFNTEMKDFLRGYVLDFMDEHNLQKQPIFEPIIKLEKRVTDDIRTIELDSLPEELDSLNFEDNSFIEIYDERTNFLEDAEQEEDYSNTSIIEDIEKLLEASYEVDLEQSILFENIEEWNSFLLSGC